MKSILPVSALAILASTFTPAFAAQDNPLLDRGSWPELREDIAGNAPLHDGKDIFEVAAPYRAHDAATVPVVITQKEGAPDIRQAMIVIDENPAPVAAEITFSDAMMPLDFETRIRVDQYSNVRVLAETDQGSYMQGRFVKASGGCSAPATKDMEVALATMGQMRLKHFGDAPAMSNARREAQIMIRHPNYSGLSRDQITHLFINAHFIHDLEVFQGDELLFRLEGGISISENPVFRFHYRDNGAATFRVKASDTEGNVSEKEMAKDVAS